MCCSVLHSQPDTVLTKWCWVHLAACKLHVCLHKVHVYVGGNVHVHANCTVYAMYTVHIIYTCIGIIGLSCFI